MGVVFIHIPKTGGTYVTGNPTDPESALSPIITYGHVRVRDEPSKMAGLSNTIPPNQLRNHHVFSIVRNPFSWLVSYTGHAAGWNPEFEDPSHYDYRAANQGFEYLVRRIADRDYPWPSRRLLFLQLFNGHPIVERVLRTESLDKDLESLAKDWGLVYNKHAPARQNPPVYYTDFYSADLICLVEETWGRELKLFGYTLEGQCQGLVSDNLDGASYDHKRDELFYKGRIVD